MPGIIAEESLLLPQNEEGSEDTAQHENQSANGEEPYNPIEHGMRDEGITRPNAHQWPRFHFCHLSGFVRASPTPASPRGQRRTLTPNIICCPDRILKNRFGR
jgi:hypothetical protein